MSFSFHSVRRAVITMPLYNTKRPIGERESTFHKSDSQWHVRAKLTARRYNSDFDYGCLAVIIPTRSYKSDFDYGCRSRNYNCEQ